MAEHPIVERPTGRDDELKVRKGAVRFLTIPEHRFVAIDGEGPAGGEAFEARLPGLYAAAYSARSALRRRGATTSVGPLESLWWTTEGLTDLDDILDGDRATWRWTLMIALPDNAAEEEVDEHLAAGRAKLDPSLATPLRADRYREGDAAQILHVGPYAEERPAIERLHLDIAEAGFVERGRHHEIYIGDRRRTAPERLRTILRHPVAPANLDD